MEKDGLESALPVRRRAWSCRGRASSSIPWTKEAFELRFSLQCSVCSTSSCFWNLLETPHPRFNASWLRIFCMEVRSVTNDEYVRVERPNRTTLITIDLGSSTTVDLKKKISAIFNIPEKSMQLYLQDVPQDRELKKLADPVLLSAQGVADGAAVLLVCLKNDGVWEDIDSLTT